MREMAIAVGTQDAARMIKACLMGVCCCPAPTWNSSSGRSPGFRALLGQEHERAARHLPDEFHQFAGQFRELIYDLPFQIPEDLVLLGRTIGILSGMCTGLDPISTCGRASPSPRIRSLRKPRQPRQWLDEPGSLARLLLGMPRRVDGLLGKVERGDLAVHDPQIVSRLDRLERTAGRLIGGLVFSALLLSGVQLYLAGQALFAWFLLAGAAITLGWVILAKRS
jgi:hypothetical protein